jgi:CIC family chloride channel protein
MGAGYESIDQALHNQFTWKMMAVLALLKILATIMSFVSGTPGGTFAPTLFVGAMLGGAVGNVEHIFFPQLTASTATYVLVGMGVLFAGFLRAPMTSVFMVLEVSGNYSIILPVIVANTISYVISRMFQQTPIFDVLSRQDGLDLPSMEEQREENVLRVEDALQPAPEPVLDADDTIENIVHQIQTSTAEDLLVRLAPSGWSIISRQHILTLAGEGKGDHTLGSLLTHKRIPFLHLDHPLDTALRFSSDAPLIPVVSRANFRHLEGVISQAGVLDRYKDLEKEPVD